MTSSVYKILFYHVICLQFATCSLQTQVDKLKKVRARLHIWFFFCNFVPDFNWRIVAIKI